MSLGGGALRRIRFHLAPAAAFVAAACIALTPLPSARTQVPQARIQLVGQPAWHEPGDRLNTTVRVTNTGATPLERHEIRLRMFPAVGGRIELHDSFDGVSGLETDVELGPSIPSLDPGESTDVTLDARVDGLSGLTTDGVYPTTLAVVDEGLSTELDSINTELIFYATSPENPLNMVVAMPLAGVALTDPGGGFTMNDEGRPRVAEALDPNTGWLAGMLGALSKAGERRDTGFAAGLAPSPRLIDELSVAARSFASPDEDSDAVRAAARQALSDLSTLMTSGPIQPLLSPYGFVDLPTLTARFDQEALNRQLTEAEIVLDETLPDVPFDPRWFFAPGLRWDGGSLADVRIAGSDNAGRTFFTRHAISGIQNPDVGCPDVNQLGFAFACPVEVLTEGRPVGGFVADPGVQDRLLSLAQAGNDRIELQQFFAETAMIHLEQPDTPERVVSLSVPSQLHPRPYMAQRLISGMAGAPWLELLTPSRGLAVGPSFKRRDLTSTAPQLQSQPEEDYFVDIDEASGLVARYEELNPPPGRVRRLHRNLLVAQSRVWWTEETVDEGQAFATETQAEVEAEFDKITIEGLDTTLTSQSAPVELTVFNNTTYSVTIDLELSSGASGEIVIDRDDLADLQDLRIAAENNQQITVDARAQSSGIFQLNAVVKTPQTGFEINERTITIRSTNFNRIALGLTFGALAFLVLFYTWRWLRRRRAAASEQAQT
jgi:Family of unknown function (DUF6049)